MRSGKRIPDDDHVQPAVVQFFDAVGNGGSLSGASIHESDGAPLGRGFPVDG